MKKIFFAILVLLFSYSAFCQVTYTFTGNGNWTAAANWDNNTIPPSILTAGNTININPAAGDSCILNTNQTISFGANFNIYPNAIFIILNGMTVTGGLPTVSTDTFYLSTNTRATGRGQIITTGASEIISKGFVWDTLPGPAIDHSTVILQTDTFSTLYCTINGLKPNTTYYLEAFATNSAGTAYGNEKIIIVPPLPPVPIVYTDTIGNVTNTSARCGGIINGVSITAKGLVWDTLPNPTIALASKSVTNVAADTFINYIYSLYPGKTYYIKAYATNAGGTSYGEQRIVTTLPAAAGDSFFTDTRDGHVYTCRQIGSQTWMTMNLNYVTPAGSWYYNNDEAYGAVYGRLYNWNAAMVSAPPGWHLPSVEEFINLNKFLGGDAVAGGKLKEAGTAHWQTPNTGADNSSGFTALAAGYRSVSTAFSDMGLLGSWWSSTEFSTLGAYALRINYDSAYSNPGTQPAKGVGDSVRCVKNY